ncbi:hypothetical protein ACLOJK_037162 [Asimina triloba]
MVEGLLDMREKKTAGSSNPASAHAEFDLLPGRRLSWLPDLKLSIGGAADDLVQEMNKGAATAAHRLDSEDAVGDVRRRWSQIQHVLTKLLIGSDH